MKGIIAIAAIAASASAGFVSDTINNVFKVELPGFQDPELRLIELDAKTREWLTEDQVLGLKRAGKTFFDVTEFAHRYENRVAVLEDDQPRQFPLELRQGKTVRKLAETLEKDNLITTLTEFSGFYTRYCKSEYGLNSSLWLHDYVKDLAKDRDDISVTNVDHSWQQKSLIARINGTSRAHDVVVVGAHQDSINLLFPSLLGAPGADDDGSGTVTILEVFRTIVESGFKPENTLEFHWYSAEELGLWGSQDIFNTYADNHVRVKAMLQQDMTGYSAGSKAHGGKDALGIITDFVDPALTAFLKLVVDEYCEIDYVETQCGYACSDHASAAKVGYPSAFVIESEFSKSDHFIHTTRDTLDKLDFDHMLEHCKLTLGYAVELSQHKF